MWDELRARTVYLHSLLIRPRLAEFEDVYSNCLGPTICRHNTKLGQVNRRRNLG